jgi:hypothetical protein
LLAGQGRADDDERNLAKRKTAKTENRRPTKDQGRSDVEEETGRRGVASW